MAARTNSLPLKGKLSAGPRGSSAQIQQGQYPTVLGTSGRGALEDDNLSSLTTTGGGVTPNTQPVSGKGRY